MNNLGALLRDLGRLEEAAELATAAVEGSRRTLGDAHAQTATFLGQRARTLAAMKRFPEAESDALLGRQSLDAAFGAAHEKTRSAIQILVDVYRAWDTAEPGAGHDVQATDWKAKLDAAAAAGSGH